MSIFIFFKQLTYTHNAQNNTHYTTETTRRAHTQHNERSRRIGRARASRQGDGEFGSRSSQTQIGTCRFLAWCSALFG